MTRLRRVAIGLIAIVVAVAGILAYAATKPATITIERAIDINAPPERVFSLINDLRRWPEWPTDDDQAKATRAYGTVSSGLGATSDWTGPGSAGSGRMEITESRAPSRVVVTVDFRKPFAAHNVNDFALELRGAATRVTWSWRGQNVFILKLLSVFASPDKIMGNHFETGLRALKAVAERQG